MDASAMGAGLVRDTPSFHLQACHRLDRGEVNGYVESLNGKLRDELLNGEIFYSVKEAKVLIEMWRTHPLVGRLRHRALDGCTTDKVAQRQDEGTRIRSRRIGV